MAPLLGCAWETDWGEDLDELWTWIRTVAAQLVDGGVMTHERIVAAEERAERATGCLTSAQHLWRTNRNA